MGGAPEDGCERGEEDAGHQSRKADNDAEEKRADPNAERDLNEKGHGARMPR